ncbi:MAG: hypothetical protein P4L53_26025 [Candidatus Obscuribacterales bacterium]|nr:hypothetical protein [Candidatus Obscuribacterales bacterium]
MQNQARSKFGYNACLSIAVYLSFALYFTFCYFPNDYFSRNLSNIVLLPGFAILLFAYWRGYRIVASSNVVGFKELSLFALATAVCAFAIPPFYSTDLYSYINGGWQQARYGVNPYTLMTVGTPGYGIDPMFTPFWALNPFPYGFLFALIAKLVCLLGAGNLTLTLQLFKVLMLLAYFCLGAVIYFGAKALPGMRPTVSFYLFMWSPIVLLHTVSNGHNDILMTLPVLTAFYCLWCNLFLPVIPLLLSGVLIKYLWLFSIPFFMVYIAHKSSLAKMFASSGIGLVWAALISLPFIFDLPKFQWLEIQKNLSVNANSLPALIDHLHYPIAKLFFHKQAPNWLDYLLNYIAASVEACAAVLFFFLWLFLLQKLFRQKSTVTPITLLRYCLLLALLAVCIVSGKFYPWYIIMFFPMSLWLPERDELRKLAITLSCTQLFAVTLIGHDHVNNFLLLTLVPIAYYGWRFFNRNHLGLYSS